MRASRRGLAFVPPVERLFHPVEVKAKNDASDALIGPLNGRPFHPVKQLGKNAVRIGPSWPLLPPHETAASPDSTRGRGRGLSAADRDSHSEGPSRILVVVRDRVPFALLEERAS